MLGWAHHLVEGAYVNNHPIETQTTTHGEFVIYRTDDGLAEVHLRLIDGSVWMTQAQIAELFDTALSTVSEHLRNIYKEDELTRDRTLRKIRNVRPEGDRDVTRTLTHYNLDAIIAVGYRVTGPRGSQFRRWASEVLKEYLVKGFALNDEKLKDPRGTDYFDELLARIRDIRSSEARLYLKLRDIISLASDYDPSSERSRGIFSSIQDKLHYAITGNTASEIIATRCNPSEDNLGLTSFKGARVRKGDVTTAKNYLTHDELTNLNLLVSQYLDFAELQARNRKVVYMKDWLERTTAFIEFNDFPVLQGKGRITRVEADKLAHERYAVYDAARKEHENALLESELVETMKSIEQRILADRDRLRPRGTDQQID